MKKSERTRARIQKTALALFASKGPNATTVRDIAAAADLADGTLYRYYPSKEALTKDLYLTGAQKVATDLEALHQSTHDLEGFLAQTVVYLCQVFDENPDAFAYIFLSQPSVIRQLAAVHFAPHNMVKMILEPHLRHRQQVALHDADLVTAQILGVITQTAQSILLGYINGPMTGWADDIMFSVLRIVRD